MDKKLESKLIKAKIELMNRSAFISTIALSMQHVITPAVATADVGGTTIRYNPKLIEEQSVAQFAGLIAHECWHVAFQHLARRGNRDPIIWNVAADYVINHMLNQAGFELPFCGIIDAKYDDSWSTDAVYDDLTKKQEDFDTSKLMLDLQNDSNNPSIDSDIIDIILKARIRSQISDNEPEIIPDEICRIIDKLLNPKLPWPIILNRFLDQRTRDEYSWARKNRRFSTDYLPSLHSIGLGHLTFAIDTSGSIGDEELQRILSELKGIRDVFNPVKMTIIGCDAVIHNIYEIDQSTDILSLEFSGGGGTLFQPVLDYMKKNPAQALVYFTDLYGETNLDPVDYPILWICTGDHEPSCIGETIYIS